jgi:hypothetical protein
MALLYDGQPPTAHAEGGKVSAIGPKPSDVRRTGHGHFAIAARERAIKFVDYCRGLLRKRPR